MALPAVSIPFASSTSPLPIQFIATHPSHSKLITENYMIHKTNSIKTYSMETPSTLASSRYSSPSEFNNSNLMDDSFSSYLALIKQSFSNNDLTSSNPRRSSFGAIIPPTTTRTSEDNGELDVFGAEKYFSGTLDIQEYSPEVLTFDSISKLSERTTKPSKKSRSSTCSDISATNSHSVLLRNRRPIRQGSAARCRRYIDFFRWCSCSKRNDVEVEDVGSRSNRSLHKEPSSELMFGIDSASMGSHPVYEPSEASIEWSVVTASASEGVKERRSSGLLNFGSTRDKSAGVAGESVGAALERYHIMMDLDPASVVGVVAARPRRPSLG